MASINDFKANLIGGGARANQFRVTITPPPGIAIGLDVRRTSFMCKGTNLPAQELTPIEVPFRGRKIYIAGDREFGETWTTTFINDTDFMIRNAMERWSNGINDLALNTGVIDPADYQTDLTFQPLAYELPIMEQDSVFKINRNRWHENLAKDIYMEEALNVLYDLKNSYGTNSTAQLKD